MLEILVIWNLCKKNAAARGRPAGMAYLYSIAVWVLAEGLGVFIGAAIVHTFGWVIMLAPLWIFAFVFAFVVSGGTRLIAKRSS